MNNSVIEEIFCWASQDREECVCSAEQQKFLDKIDKLYTKFCSELKGEELDNFKKICECFDGMAAEESESFFAMGFRLGLKLAAECFLSHK